MHVIGRTLVRVVGVALIGLVLWQVGWQDRVTSGDTRYYGRIVEMSERSVVLDTDRGRERITVEGPNAVRRGLAGAFSQAGQRPALLLLGVLVQLLGMFADCVRWTILLRGAGLATDLKTAIRLSWIGNFASDVFPVGATGGDVVKAVYIARLHPRLMTRSVVTVFMDRVVGFVVISLTAAVAVGFAPPAEEFAVARVILYSLACVSLAVSALVLWSRAGAVLPALVPHWVPARGIVEELGRAVAVYSSRPAIVGKAAAVSAIGHATSLSSFFFFAAAMDSSLPVLAVLVAIPVAQVLASVPGLPGGWGVGDFAFLYFLPAAGVEPAVAVTLSFIHRISHALLSLPAASMLVGSGAAPRPAPQSAS